MAGRGRQIKILHTSDVHLDAYTLPHVALAHEKRDKILTAFRRVIDLALAEEVDLMVIAGDFFDSSRAPEEVLEFAVQQLRRLSAPVVILPGNHDCLAHNSVYRRVDFPRQCSNVHVIGDDRGELLTFSELDLALWGRANLDPPMLKPLEGLPPRGPQRWQVALAHGHLLLPQRHIMTSLPITVEEIAASGVDYLALGHWEFFQDVSTPPVVACYSGAPMPLMPGLEDKGRVVLVHLEDGQGARAEPVELSKQLERSGRGSGKASAP